MKNEANVNAKSLVAKGHERDLKGIKKLMEKRSEQRVFAFYFLTDKKIPTALIYGRQLLFTSQKIWK